MEMPTDAEPVKVIEGDCLDVLRSLPDASVDLVLTDPPYFRVKSEPWDNQWDTSEGFLRWLGEVCDEWRRVLKPNGSLYCFASSQMIARVELLIGSRLNVLQRIVWAKPAYSTKAEMNSKEGQRSYFPRTEYVVFAEQRGSDELADDASGYSAQCEATKRTVIGDYLRAEFRRAGVTNRQVASLFPSAAGGLTGCVSNWLLGYNLPTPEQYAAMRDLLNQSGGEYLRREYEELRREYEDLRREYEELRREYEELRRPFSVTESVPYTDVWEYPTVNTYPGKHPCEKPVRMFRDIIRASSRPGAVVLDCFAGSGTTGRAAISEERRAILIEKDPAHAETCRRRVAEAMGVGKGSLLTAMPDLLAGVA